jgi:tape measure domain-containing protein
MNATSTIGIKLAIDGATQAEAQLGRVGSSMQQLGNAADGIRSSLGQLAGAFAGVVSVQQFMQAADAVTALQNNLRLATGSTAAATQAFDGLFQAAQRSRTSFTELGNTYASIARASESLKLSQGQLLSLTETIGNAITVSGASAQASQAALVQLGQGLASGTLRGEELNSILEQTPRLAKALADGLGVSTGALRKLGEEGKLTAEAVVGALQSQQKVLAQEVATSVTTVSQAYTQLQNAATALVGTIDAATGSSGTMASAIQAVAASLGDIQSAFKGVNAEAGNFQPIADGIGVAFEAISVLGVNVSFVMKAIGREIGGLVAQAEQFARGGGLIPMGLDALINGSSKEWNAIKAIRAEMVADAEKARADVDALSERIVRARQLRNLAESANAGLDFSAENARLARQAGNTVAAPLDFSKVGTTAKAAKKEVDEFAAALDRVLAKDSGLNSDYAKTLETLFAGYQKGRISVEGYADAVAKLISQQPFVKQGLEAQAQAAAAANAAWDELFEAQERARLANEKQIETARTYLDQVQFETQLLGLNAEQRALATAVRELESQGIKEGTQAYAAYIDKIKEAIRLREGKAAEIKAADDAAAAWKKASEDIERSLTDALMRGFESGKGFAEVLRDTVANMFRTLVLRPVVQAIVSPLAAGITTGLGMPGVANAATGAGSALSGVSGLGTIGSTLGAFGTGLGAGGSMIAGGGISGWLSASTSLIGTGTAAGAAAGLGALAGPIGAVLAVAQLVKSLDDSGTYHTGGLGGFSRAGGAVVGDAAKAAGLGFDLNSRDYTASGQQAAVAMAKTITGILDQTATTFGQKAGYFAATAFADDTSKDGAWGALLLKLGDQMLIDWQNGTDRWPGREFANGEAGAKEYAAAVATDVRDYLLTQTPDWADAMLQALGEAPTLEQLGETVAQINAAQMALDGMGRASEAFAAVGEDAANTLIKALGGAQAAAQAMGSYYSNFYSDAERQAITRSQLTAAAQSAGISALPTSRQGYRDLVDSTLASGNTELAAALIQYSDAFASVTDNIAAQAATVQQAAARPDTSVLDGLREEEARLRIEEARAFGDTAEELRLLTLGMNAFERELFLSNRSLVDNIAAQQRVTALGDERKGLEIDLLRAQGNTTAALALLTAGMGEAERAAYLYNEGLRTQIKAAGEANSLNQRLLQATGNTAELRRQELAALEPANRALQERIWAIEDEATAYATLRNTLATLTDNAEAETNSVLAALQQQAATTRKNWQDTLAIARDLSQEVRGVFDTLQSGADGLFASVESNRPLQGQQAQQFIATALAAARATGALPEQKELSRAISQATAGLDATQYASQAEADFARLVLANELRDLQAISGDQLTEAERQVKAAEATLTALDDLLANAQEQIDAVRDVSKHTGTTAQLMAQLLAALGQESAIKNQIKATNLVGSGQAIYNLGTGAGTNAAGEAFTGAAVAQAARDALAAGATAQQLYATIQSSGYSLAQAEKILGATPGSLADEARKMGLPVFDIGTNYVPRNTLAMVHEGEAIVPKAFNPWANGAGAGNGQRMEQLTQQLLERIAAMEAQLVEANRQHRRAADAVNGNPEYPMVVEIAA